MRRNTEKLAIARGLLPRKDKGIPHRVVATAEAIEEDY